MKTTRNRTEKLSRDNAAVGSADERSAESSGETCVQEREDGVERARQALRRLVRESNLTQRAVEERSGFKRGYLSQVLQGHIALSLRHVLGILLATGTSPGTFFAELFPPSKESSADSQQIDEIRERMARYDSALRELEDKGLLAPSGDEGSDDTRR